MALGGAQMVFPYRKRATTNPGPPEERFSSEDHFGIILGLFRDRFGVVVGIILGSFLGSFGGRFST